MKLTEEALMSKIEMRYRLRSADLVLSHGPGAVSWVHDIADGREYIEADALAASGDYFMVLATKLDLLAQSLPRDSSEQIEVEHLVTTLFYLEKHYKVVAKSKLR